ncbi:MAG: hypothetical protein IPK19_20650 [Chloroflexi bacterium]|nr:hypothetical protein [Chloroflexota bacterium]
MWRSAGLFTNNYYTPPAAYTEAMVRLSTNFDRETRRRDIRSIADLFFEDVPYTPVYQTSDFFATREDINWQTHPLFYIDLRPYNFSL